jgi:hypothetical protein
VNFDVVARHLGYLVAQVLGEADGEEEREAGLWGAGGEEGLGHGEAPHEGA